MPDYCKSATAEARRAAEAADRTDHAVKADLFAGNHLFVGVNAFEPGQNQRVHVHDEADKTYIVLEGRAVILVGDDRIEAGPGDVVWAPAGVPHGVERAIERSVVAVAMSRSR
jgi:quercetin dioxygenase-like cupin family protein